MVYWVIGRRKPMGRVDREPEHGPSAERFGPFESLEAARQARLRAAAGALAPEHRIARFEIVCDYA